MEGATERIYGGVSGPQRRENRRRRLLQAGLEVLGSQGWGAATVTAICEQAGVIPRYFYESFKDRDEFLLALFDEILDEVGDEAAKRMGAGDTIADLIRASIGAWMSVVQADPRKGRVAFVEALGSERLMERRLRATRDFTDVLVAQAEDVYDVSDRNKDAVMVAALISSGGLIETMIEWVRAGVPVPATELADHYARLCQRMFDAAIDST